MVQGFPKYAHGRAISFIAPLQMRSFSHDSNDVVEFAKLFDIELIYATLIIKFCSCLFRLAV